MSLRIYFARRPWPSRSAARRASYHAGDYRAKSLESDGWREGLLTLPLQELVDPAAGSLIAVWVTNDRKIADWVRLVLFPRWGVRYVTTWYWLKMTARGDPVLPISETASRKTWEPLILGVVSDDDLQDGEEEDLLQRAASLAEPLEWRRPAPFRGSLKKLRRALAFSSTPDAHSCKPRLDALFASAFSKDAPRKLELFARGTFHGWTTFGDQALDIFPD